MSNFNRRAFLSLTAAAGVPARAASTKPLRGIFPIMQTPFTADDKVDIGILVKQAHYLAKCGVHGMVWPQLASEWASLRPEERFQGATALANITRAMRPAFVIGVQAPTIDAAVEYARHAERLAPDAIIAIPQPGVTAHAKLFEYYKAIGAASTRPFFVQAIGDMSAEFIVEMSKAISTLRYIKDEAGPPLPKLSFYREKHPELHPFTGNHGELLFEEMLRGSAGNMPAATVPDLYSAAWDLFHAGKRAEAAQMCMRTTWLLPTYRTYGMPGLKYILELRGVFANNFSRGGKPAVVKDGTPLDDEAKRNIKEMLDQLKPWLKA